MESSYKSPDQHRLYDNSYPVAEETKLSYDKLQKYQLSSNQPENDVEITISNPLIKDSLLKYVVYTISGKDKTGTFEAYRRYKDFEALRNLLIRHWPGCVIPKIPPKQTLGNLEGDFIEQRRKLLEAFLVRVANTSYLHQSEEFHMFLRGPNEYHKAITNFRRPTYDQLASTYQSIFPTFADFQVTENIHKELEESFKYFQQGQITLEIFHGKSKMCVDYFAYYKNELFGMFQGLKGINAQYLESKNEIQFDLLESKENPYGELLDWIRIEILDMGGMIEAFKKKKEYERIKEKIVERIDDERKKLLNLQLDKKTVMQFLVRKPKEFYTDKISKTIQELELELKSVNTINNIIAGRLMQVEIPRFRKSKTSVYEAVIRNLTSSSNNQLEFIIAQTKKIEESLN